jgi:hypothetical protein
VSHAICSRVFDEDIIKGKSIVVIEDSMEAHRSVATCHINDNLIAAAVCSSMGTTVTGLLFLAWRYFGRLLMLLLR